MKPLNHYNQSSVSDGTIVGRIEEAVFCGIRVEL
jgi:hypothetical protein